MEESPNSPSPATTVDPSTASAARPRVWTVFVAVVVAVVAAIVMQIVAVVVIILLHSAGGDVQTAVRELQENVTETGYVILLMACGQGAFAIVMLAAVWLSPVPFRDRLELKPARPSWTIYPLTTFASLIPLAIGIKLAKLVGLVVPPDKSLIELYEKMTIAWSIPFVLFIALAPGIIEELLFRGYIQGRLLQRWGPAAAILVTSVIFAIVHIQPHAVAATLPLGLWFGVVAWRTGSVRPGIICHAFVNGGLNAWRMVVNFAEVPEPMQHIVTGASLLLGLVCLVLSLRLFVQAKPQSG